MAVFIHTQAPKSQFTFTTTTPPRKTNVTYLNQQQIYILEYPKLNEGKRALKVSRNPLSKRAIYQANYLAGILHVAPHYID